MFSKKSEIRDMCIIIRVNCGCKIRQITKGVFGRIVDWRNGNGSLRFDGCGR